VKSWIRPCVYSIARDPLQGWQDCDVPAYRYRRILSPLLGRLLAWSALRQTVTRSEAA